MDLETYWSTLDPAGKLAFAGRAKTSVMYIGHVVSGRKKASSLEYLLRLAEASEGALTVETIRHDMFPPTRAGRARRDLLTRHQRSA